MEPTQTGLAIPLDTGFLSCHRCAEVRDLKKFPQEVPWYHGTVVPASTVGTYGTSTVP